MSLTTTGQGLPATSPASSMNGTAHVSPDHSVQFYADDAFLLDEVSRFIGTTIVSGDAAIVLATEAHRDELWARLHAQGLDVDRAISQGRYVALDAAEVLAASMSDGWPDGARFARVMGDQIAQAAMTTNGGPRRVAIFGELVALLAAEGKHEAAIHLEHLWNELARTHAFSLHCAYPMSAFGQEADGDPVGRICAAHAAVMPLESYMSLPDDAERLRSIALLQQKAQILATEIAARKQAEQALRERNQELRAAVAARDDFLSVAAHELKTPVTGLRGFVQLLLRDARRGQSIPAARLERSLEAIERQTGKLNLLVSRLLDTAQIEAGKLRIDPVVTDLVAVVQSAMSHQQAIATHTLTYRGPNELFAVVDPVRFEQVITNLVDNAVKYSPVGSTVTVGLGAIAGGGIRLSVTDEGLGIPAAQREAVFTRFHQADYARHLSGMGLGLFISRQIIELHGGTVRIDDPGHRGSRFVVELPSSPTAAV